jgi:Sulfatase-modifying factor enzyme 1
MRVTLALSTVLSLLIASSASAVTVALTTVGNPGNPCDPQNPDPQGAGGCFGGVGYSYSIGTYEVTNAQYAEFLNAKAAIDDPFGLYNPAMGTDTDFYSRGGIARTGSAGNSSYAPRLGRGDMPVNFVSFFDALRFANWMNNGQGGGDTETGTYTLLGGTAMPINWDTVTRNGGAAIALTSDAEWYKAAYYDASGSDYLHYAAGSDTVPTCSAPTATPNAANCGNAVGGPVAVGSYPGSSSPYGVLDLVGNIAELNEGIVTGSFRGIRGTAFDSPSNGGPSGAPNGYLSPTWEDPNTGGGGRGFRLVMIPEPSTCLLVIAGLLGLGIRRRIAA